MNPTLTLEQAFHDERPRLLRWMLSRTGNHQIAEDLVQETYSTAWQNRHKLTDLSGVDSWLNAIANNILKRWTRRISNRQSHETDFEQISQDALAEYQLEQSDISDLLDKALALLSPENRAILIARYLEEQPQAKVARDLGLSESAVAVRLHRGKMTIRKILEDELNQTDDAGWQSTRIYCGICGNNHYQAKFDSEKGELILHCPDCDYHTDYPAWGSRGKVDVIQGIKTVKPAFNRLRKSHYQAFGIATAQGYLACEHCGKSASLELKMPDFIPYPAHPGMTLICPDCGVVSYTALNGIAGSTPVSFAFEKDNPRFITLPEKYLTHKGVDALQIRFQSLRSSDSMDVLFAKDSYRILSIYHNEKEVRDES